VVLCILCCFFRLSQALTDGAARKQFFCPFYVDPVSVVIETKSSTKAKKSMDLKPKTKIVNIGFFIPSKNVLPSQRFFPSANQILSQKLVSLMREKSERQRKITTKSKPRRQPSFPRRIQIFKRNDPKQYATPSHSTNTCYYSENQIF